MSYQYTFTSESVSEGHPDKVCDFIADSILDAYLAQDPKSRVACEVLVKENTVVIAGEITSDGKVDHEEIAREAIRQIGYTHDGEAFHADTVNIIQLVTKQSAEISQGVTEGEGLHAEQGAGDQGIMFGYATNETPELMPLPISLAHRLAQNLAQIRKQGEVSWLRPDVKTQVSVVYENEKPVRVSDVLVSTQHTEAVEHEEILQFISQQLIPSSLGEWYNDEIKVQVNPTGKFVHGGPSADCGVTGRKIIVDTYGGAGRHGGGAFSGKDPSKVDRSGAYFCRYVAREVVKAGLADKAEIQVSYAIGVAEPVSVKVDTFGTGDEQTACDFVKKFDFRPAAIIETLELLQPIYRQTTNYGHFGKAGLSWER
ncbi:MAG TPA: methionine adenosyltransferase [Pyrinomonadaceae bacterium]|jgi:S-adenosylmethionine synthetase